MGDYCFTAYSWSDSEAQRYMTRGVPPRQLYQLGGAAPVVPFFYCVRDLECTFLGPSVSAPLFRRLNGSGDNRLVLWDIYGRDGPVPGRAVPVHLVPTADLNPSERHRQTFKQTFHALQGRQQTPRTPPVSALFANARYLPDYVIGGDGPAVFEGLEYSALWGILTACVRDSDPLVHPVLTTHRYSDFRYTANIIHRRVVDDDVSARLRLETELAHATPAQVLSTSLYGEASRAGEEHE